MCLCCCLRLIVSKSRVSNRVNFNVTKMTSFWAMSEIFFDLKNSRASMSGTKMTSPHGMYKHLFGKEE
jgi:hypothetical protein